MYLVLVHDNELLNAAKAERLITFNPAEVNGTDLAL